VRPAARLADVAWHGLFHVPGGVSAGVTQNLHYLSYWPLVGALRPSSPPGGQ